LALDAKTLRHSRDAGQGLSALRVLNAMVHDLGIFLQTETIPTETNELGIIRPLLEEIVLRGRVVTLDAIFTNPELARTIRNQDGEYLMRVKANQPRLLADLQTWFDDPSPFSQADNLVDHTTEKSHGRLVQYTLRTTEALNDYLRDVLHWPDVGQVFRIERRCTHLRTHKVTRQTHYGITSLSFHQADPASLLQFWRHHWHIENKGHWVLDVVFGEDASTARRAGLPGTLAVLRRAVITLLRLFGHDDITRTRSRLSADVRHALSLVGAPLEIH
jgi:predicted transposase YbfD/YdcC